MPYLKRNKNWFDLMDVVDHFISSFGCYDILLSNIGCFSSIIDKKVLQFGIYSKGI